MMVKLAVKNYKKLLNTDFSLDRRNSLSQAYTVSNPPYVI